MPHSCWGNTSAGCSEFRLGSWGIVRTASANRNANQRSSQTADRLRFAFDGAPNGVEPIIVDFRDRPGEFVDREGVAADIAELLVRNILRSQDCKNLCGMALRARNYDP